ncbi:MAG TPA: choice-of-anchor D domain-containing protein [Hymenobacter sp.]|uniref:choice-of-anchor D domain-containing protein n=1 Tax=Hymenobacter sp. TaxID=1898978 RepID=UPI002EDA55CF
MIYSTTSGFNPATSGTTVVAGTPTGTGTFNASLTGLSAATTYYVVAFATNSAGTSYGAEQSFTTSAGAPTITVTGTLTAFNTFAGSVSTAQNLSISGTNLTAGIIVTPPVGYELSLVGTPGATYSSGPITLGGAGTVAATDVYVRLTGTTPTASLGPTLQIRSSGATDRDRTVSGTVVTEPTASPTVVASALGATTVTLTVSGGNGSRYFVVVRPSAAPNEVPTDGSPYTASAVYGAGSETFNGSNNFVVSAGVATSVNVTGLTPSSTYVVSAYAYNVGTVAGFENYFVPTTGTVTFTTTAAPATPLLAYDFTSGDTPSTQDANVNGSAFLRQGVSSNAGSGRFNSTGWPSTINTNEYIQFTFSPKANYLADLTSLTFVDQRSAADAGAYEVRASRDGFATSTTLLTGTTNGGNKSATLNGFTNIAAGTTVTFRFYYANSGTYSVDDVQLFGTVTTAPPAPEIDVAQGATAIASGTGSYTFGNTGVGATRDVTFTITNSGTADLTLSPTITLTGADASQYSITQQPALTTLTPSGASSSTTFVVRFEPTSAGTKAASISIANNDSNENPYTFALSGLGVPPTLTATPNALTINAAVSQSATDSYVLNGSNLPANATVSVSSNNAAVEVSTNGGGTYAATASASTSSTGTLNQSVQVRFTAGATVSTTTATITNTMSTLSALVAVTANATATTPSPVASAGLLLLEDDFNYPAGTTLNANGWAVHSGGTTEVPEMVAGNLTKATYPTGPLAPNANQVLSDGTTSDVNRGFAVPAGQNTLYYSALVNIPPGGTFPDYFLHLLDRTNAAGTTTRNFRAKLFAKEGTTPNRFVFGVSVTSNPNETPAPAYTTTEYSEGQTYLVVVKYVLVPGGSDVVALFVFDGATPLPSAEPATPSAGPLQEPNNAAFLTPNGIAIRQTDNSPFVNLDGIRVATGWGTVIGRPTYTAPAAVIKTGNYFDLSLSNADVLTPEGAVNVESNLILVSGLVNTSTTNSLTLYQPASVTGGNDASFVNGPVRRAIDGVTVPTSFVFPVGKATSYRPFILNINSQTTPSIYTAEQQEGNPGQAVLPGPGLGSAEIKRVSFFRSFDLSSTAVSNAVGTVTLSFGTNDGVNNPADPGLVVAVRNSTVPLWANFSRSASTGTGTGPGGSYVAGTLTSSLFPNDVASATFALGATNDNTTFGSAVNPLPVELSSFSAQRQAGSAAVAVKWTTASERNSAYFEVQRSLDGREFTTVAKTAAQGNSAKTTAYAALDKTAPLATLYYRLRQVDVDGTVAHSPVVTVEGTTTAATRVQLYPNPTRATVSFIAAEPTPYRVLSNLGQPLLHGTTGTGTATVHVETLPSGLYLLELQTPTGRVVQKFVKE